MKKYMARPCLGSVHNLFKTSKVAVHTSVYNVALNFVNRRQNIRGGRSSGQYPKFRPPWFKKKLYYRSKIRIFDGLDPLYYITHKF